MMTYVMNSKTYILIFVYSRYAVEGDNVSAVSGYGTEAVRPVFTFD